MESRNNHEKSLEGWKSQVAGHTVFVHIDDEHLLKICSKRETKFYKQMPESLKEIVPMCCVIIETDSVILTTTKCSSCTSEKFQGIKECLPPSILNSEFMKSTAISDFLLVLKNITVGMGSKRVIDLKMGVRAHSVEATPEKIRRKIEKLKNSTSSLCAVRLSGVLYEEEGNTLRVNKERGREMGQKELNEILHDFFDVPETIQLTIREEISKMIEIISKIDGLRLFGCSLLVAIDIENEMCALKLIDFSNATCLGLHPGSEFAGPDTDLIAGLKYICNFLKI